MSTDFQGADIIDLGADLESLDLEHLDETRGVGRRSFLIGSLAVGGALAGPVNYAAAARKRKFPFAKHGKFDLGIASGFPQPTSITVWTRLANVSKTKKLRLVVAKDPKFRKVIREKTVFARRSRDFTVRAHIKGLKPHRDYWYRFVTKENKSPVGHFRTAPPFDSAQPLRIAYYSCSSYEAGFFNAQRAIAEEKDIDLVLCLGDYVYESHYFDGPRNDRTGVNKDGDVQLYSEWLDKYRLYKADSDLQAMHAAHPFVCVWDDHEAEDNYAGEGQSSAASPGMTNNEKPQRIPFIQRRANGYRSFFNYMPRVRYKGDRDRIYERYRLGKLVDLFVTDERQYRDPQPCDDQLIVPCPDGDNPRTMLGARQKEWLKTGLAESPATWKLWGTQLMLMSLEFPPGSNVNNDGWDGYGAERKEILDHAVDHGVKNLTALTGDIHTFFAGTATTTGNNSGGRAAGTEFVGGSATSFGIAEETGIPVEAFPALTANNPHIKFADYTNRGYGLVEVGSNELTCEFKHVDAFKSGAKPARLAKFRVASGSTAVEQIG